MGQRNVKSTLEPVVASGKNSLFHAFCNITLSVKPVQTEPLRALVYRLQITYNCVYPCPCGYYGDLVKECTCSMSMVKNYQKKISGPLLDRIDIHVEVPRGFFLAQFYLGANVDKLLVVYHLKSLLATSSRRDSI